MGSVVAAYFGTHKIEVTVLAILTAVFLQILSNFANDYGDFSKGVDVQRTDRVMAAGELSLKQMKIALWVLGLISLAVGIGLLLVAFKNISFQTMVFLFLGLASIAASFYYTAGKNPYGYRGLGDVAVFLFFGILSVSGVYFLHNPHISRALWLSLLPASAFGFLSTGVLNINNIRDIDNDAEMGKITLAVTFGKQKSEKYQLLLLLLAFVCISVFMFLAGDTKGISLLLIYPLYVLHWFKLRLLNNNKEQRPAYNILLKQMVLLNALLVLVFGLILLI